MAAKLMRSDEGLRFIAQCANEGVAVSTVDGFHVVPEGCMEDVDLMFSPDESVTPAQGASAAQLFIRKNDGPDVVWEVWPDTPEASTPR